MKEVEQLIIDKLTGQIGEQDDFRLEELIARHQEVEQLWQQMQQVYAMRKAVSFDQSFNAENAWEAIQQRVNIPNPVKTPVTDTVAIQPKPVIKNWLRYGIAAAVTGIIALSVYLLASLYRSQAAASHAIEIKLANGSIVHTTVQDSTGNWMQKAREENIDPGAWNTVTVPRGKNYAFQLADGSKVWLNAASSLQFPLLFTRSARLVALQGEAYFKVAHQPRQPFVVSVNGVSVKALGTEFNIQSYQNESTSIALVTGSVSIDNGKGQQIIMKPGEEVVIDKNGVVLLKQPFDNLMVLSWMQGVYFFQNEPLQHIALVAERWFDVPVIISDASLGSLHFSGALDRNKPATTFFNMLASTGDIRYEWKHGTVVISRK